MTDDIITHEDQGLDYAEVMDDYYTRADKLGVASPNEPWLDLDGVYWPNPHFDGDHGTYPGTDVPVNPGTPISSQTYENFAAPDKED